MMEWGHTSKALLALSILCAPATVLAQSCPPDATFPFKTEANGPQAPLPSASASPARAQQAVLYLDASTSMVGYFQAREGKATGAKNIVGTTLPTKPYFVDALLALRQVMTQSAQTVSLRKFGMTIEELPPDQYIRIVQPDFYYCTRSGKAPCFNSESHIDAVLKEALVQPAHRLTLIATDLFFNSTDIYGTAEGSMIRPAVDLLLAGRSIGIYGINTAFSGMIYDLPSPDTTYDKAKAHPAYFLIIGEAAQVEEVRQRLDAALPQIPAAYKRFQMISPPKTAHPLSASQLAEKLKSAALQQNWFSVNRMAAVPIPAFRYNRTAKPFSFNIDANDLNYIPHSVSIESELYLNTMLTDSKGCPKWINLSLNGSHPIATAQTDGTSISIKVDNRHFDSLQTTGTYVVHSLVRARSEEALSSEKKSVFVDWSVDEFGARRLQQTKTGLFFPTLNLQSFLDGIQSQIEPTQKNPTLAEIIFTLEK